jgi:replicative DNA helicase
MVGNGQAYVPGEKLTTVKLEATILASVIQYGRAALVELPDLSTDDFSLPTHRQIFTTCARLDADGVPVDLVTVGQELSHTDAFETFNYLPGDFPVRSQLAYYVRQLRRARSLQRVFACARNIAALESDPRSIEDRLADAQTLAQRMIGASAGADDDVLIPLSEIAETEIRKLDCIRRGEEDHERLTTGIVDLDRMLYVEPGDLVIVGGETSSGKSALCGQLAAHYAQTGKGVVFVTTEMTHRQMLARIVSSLTGVSVATLVNPREAANARAEEHYRTFAGCPIFFQRRFPPRISEAVAAIRVAVARHNVRLAVIDYAQRLAELDEERQEQAIARIAHESKNLALELGIVVVAAAQVNRQNAQRRDPRPILADLRGSGRLEQDADTVIFTYQPALHGKGGAPELIVAKQRNGKTGQVKVHFHAETCTFRDLEVGSANRGFDAQPRRDRDRHYVDRGRREGDRLYAHAEGGAALPTC